MRLMIFSHRINQLIALRNSFSQAANIRRFEAELSHLPRYITEGDCGAGFAEAAAALLAARRL